MIFARERYCTVCGTVGYPARITKGHVLMELALWICFLVPGLIYSLWRLVSRHDGCCACGSTAIVPLDSPVAQRALPTQLATSDASANSSPAGPVTALMKQISDEPVIAVFGVVLVLLVFFLIRSFVAG